MLYLGHSSKNNIPHQTLRDHSTGVYLEALKIIREKDLKDPALLWLALTGSLWHDAGKACEQVLSYLTDRNPDTRKWVPHEIHSAKVFLEANPQVKSTLKYVCSYLISNHHRAFRSETIPSHIKTMLNPLTQPSSFTDFQVCVLYSLKFLGRTRPPCFLKKLSKSAIGT